MTIPKRHIYRVQWSSATERWEISCNRHGVTSRPTKALALAWAVEAARESEPSQVVIYKKDGRIQEERTYGKDPRRHKG